MKTLLLSAIITLFSNIAGSDDCDWGSPSLRNCKLDYFSRGSYTIYPICPKCGNQGSSGQSSGLGPAHKGEVRNIKATASCIKKSCLPSGDSWYNFDYGFTVTANCN